VREEIKKGGRGTVIDKKVGFSCGGEEVRKGGRGVSVSEDRIGKLGRTERWYLPV